MSDNNLQHALHMARIEYYLSLGSNCGDREQSIGRAVEWLGGILDDIRVSEIYETKACPDKHGLCPAPTYFNAVVRGSLHDSDAASLSSRLKQYERDCGRDEHSRSLGLVPIDIDVVEAGGEVVRPGDKDKEHYRLGREMLGV